MARGDLADLRQRLRAEGLDYLTDAEADEFVVQAVDEIGLERQWPQRVRTSGLQLLPYAPLGGLDRVILVLDERTGRPLSEGERTQLLGRGVDLTQQGQAECWYFDHMGRINTWPVTTRVTVEYLSPAMWDSGTDEPAGDYDMPLLPQSARNLAVQLAAAKAFEQSGRADAGASKRALVEAGIEREFAPYSRQVTQRRVRVVD